MSHPPVLDIVIPTFRRPEALHRLLHSLETNGYGRTDGAIRITISENGGSDSALAVFDRWKERLPLAFVKRQTPLGMLLHLAHCYAMGSGKYLWLIGDDDEIVDLPWETLERTLAQNPAFVLVRFKSRDPNYRPDAFEESPPALWPCGEDLVSSWPIQFTFLSSTIFDRARLHEVLHRINIGNAYFPVEIALRVGFGKPVAVLPDFHVLSDPNISWATRSGEYHNRHMPMLVDELASILPRDKQRRMMGNIYGNQTPPLLLQLQHHPYLCLYFVSKYRTAILAGIWRRRGWRGVLKGCAYFAGRVLTAPYRLCRRIAGKGAPAHLPSAS